MSSSIDRQKGGRAIQKIMKKIKMIAIDLDGSLLTSNKELSSYSLKVLQEAIARGIEIVIATGRAYRGLPEEIKEIKGIRYVITSNGAKVFEFPAEKILHQRNLPKQKALESLAIFKKYDTLPEVYYHGQGYAPEGMKSSIPRFNPDPAIQRYIRDTRVFVPDVWELVDQTVEDLEKAQAHFACLKERKTAWAELAEISGITIASSLHYNIEINAGGTNKGASLLAIGKLLGIAQEEMMGIGDSGNDLALLRVVGHSVAMGNADEEVKAIAYYVTSTNDEDGAAKAIERIL